MCDVLLTGYPNSNEDYKKIEMYKHLYSETPLKVPPPPEQGPPQKNIGQMTTMQTCYF